MNELVSVIIPVYQAEEYIERCINSILNQTYKNLDIIFVNDGSTDRSVEIITEYAQKDERVRLLHQENKGAGAARNKGIEAAKGKYIGFVDSDDWIEPDMYEYLVKILEREKADIAACDFVSTDKMQTKIENDVTEKLIMMSKKELMEFFLRMHGEKSFYAVWNMLYKREIIEHIKFPEGKITEDLLFNYWAYCNCNKYVLSNQKKYYYYCNPKGVTRNSLGETDLALLRNWDIIVEDILLKQDDVLVQKAARLNRWRADFTLLSKAVLYGYKESEISKEILNDMARNMKAHRAELLKGKALDWKRKILLIVLCLKYVRIPWRQ